MDIFIEPYDRHEDVYELFYCGTCGPAQKVKGEELIHNPYWNMEGLHPDTNAKSERNRPKEKKI